VGEVLLKQRVYQIIKIIIMRKKITKSQFLKQVKKSEQNNIGRCPKCNEFIAIGVYRLGNGCSRCTFKI
jgi:uncharacterized protein with PIN domain